MFVRYCQVNKKRKQNKVYLKWSWINYDGAGLWNFGNEFSSNVAIFRFDTSLSRHSENLEINFLTLGKASTHDISVGVGNPEGELSINFTKPKRRFSLHLYYNGD